MAYLGNEDLGKSLSVGGGSSALYNATMTDFMDRVDNMEGGMTRKPILFMGKGKAKDMEKVGQEVAQLLMKHNPHLQGGIQVGGSFWDGFKKGFNKVIKPLAKVVKTVAPIVAPGYGTAIATGLDLVGYGKKTKTKPKKPRKQSEKMKRRRQMVSKLIEEEGMTLVEASKYIKQNNLI